MASGALPRAATVLADLPTGDWRLDDQGAMSADASGHGFTGSIAGGIGLHAGGALVNDADDAMDFDGQSGSIAPGNGTGFTGTAASSIEAWIKPAVVDDQFRHGFTKEHRDAPREGYALLVQVGAGVELERFFNDEPPITGKSVTVPPTTRFTHVVATYDGTLMQLYVDGRFVGSTANRKPQNSVPDPAPIDNSGSSGGFFDGTIDEVAVYSTELTDARIQAHYQAGTVP